MRVERAQQQRARIAGLDGRGDDRAEIPAQRQ
jgi:hypothetical protein